MAMEFAELAKNIKDEKLRAMTIGFLKDIQLSHLDFRMYPKARIEECFTLFAIHSSQGEVVVKRDVLKHTKALVELCMKLSETLRDVYNIKVNHDYLIASAILHDLMKIFEWRQDGLLRKDTRHTGILLDHTMLAVAELYHRGFPEEVVHIVASHFGPRGPTPPRTPEAHIFHQLDTMISALEAYLGDRG